MESIWNFLLDNIGTISAIVIPLIFGAGFLMLKNVANLVKELGEALTALGTALADGKVSKEEVELIVKEVKDVIASFSLLFGKKK